MVLTFHSQCQQSEGTELDREVKTELKETESERLVERLPILRKERQRGKHGEAKTATVKLLCHAILALSKGCNTSLMSTTVV